MSLNGGDLHRTYPQEPQATLCMLTTQYYPCGGHSWYTDVKLVQAHSSSFKLGQNVCGLDQAGSRKSSN